MLFGILPSPTPSPLIGLSKCNEFICLCVCLYVCNKVNVLAVVVDDDIVCLFVVGFVVLNLYACVCVCVCVCYHDNWCTEVGEDANVRRDDLYHLSFVRICS